MAQLTTEAQARVDDAIRTAAHNLNQALGISVARATDLIRSLLDEPDLAYTIQASDLRPAAWVAQLRGYALGEDPDVARWTLAEALDRYDSSFDQFIGQTFLDYLSQTVGAGLQPTLGGLSSARCDQVRAALETAGRAYVAANPTLGFVATIRAWSIRAARNGGNAVSLDRNRETRQLLRALNDAAAWLNE